MQISFIVFIETLLFTPSYRVKTEFKKELKKVYTYFAHNDEQKID